MSLPIFQYHSLYLSIGEGMAASSVQRREGIEILGPIFLTNSTNNNSNTNTSGDLKGGEIVYSVSFVCIHLYDIYL